MIIDNLDRVCEAAMQRIRKSIAIMLLEGATPKSGKNPRRVVGQLFRKRKA